MKLELKHLAGYLPYGLKIYTDGYSDTKVITVNGYHTYDDLGIINISSTEKHGGQNLSEVKLILRPLSDLTKEIEVNGEKFVPLKKMGYNVSWYGWDYYKINIIDQKYSDIQKLLEWHFDIYGLIEAKLAIDINTL